jgi:ferritin-like metal-binding protein YciE
MRIPMPAHTPEEQLVKYLSDAYSIEVQALAQLKMAPKLAGHPKLEQAFKEHLTETEGQQRLIGQRLEAHGASPSKIKNVVMAAGGVGFALFAKFQPDTPGKLTAHAYSYEALEQASYEALIHIAEKVGDGETVEAARRIRDQEIAMKDRLANSFDEAVEASLRDLDPDDIGQQLNKYLSDAHAIENQSIQLLEKGPSIAGDPELANLFEHHLEESREHQRLVDERLTAREGRTNSIKDAAMRLGAINWGGFFAAQPDTPGKLCSFAFAFEHLEMGGYEQLRRVAEHAADGHTIQMAESILAQERSAAGQLELALGRAVDASLEAQGVAA